MSLLSDPIHNRVPGHKDDANIIGTRSSHGLCYRPLGWEDTAQTCLKPSLNSLSPRPVWLGLIVPLVGFFSPVRPFGGDGVLCVARVHQRTTGALPGDTVVIWES